nr:hypothetical protein Iba_chr09fCG13700 [Ipomoea batatas]
MLHQRKIAHGCHEVGDTWEDPLSIPSDEEKGAVVLVPPKAEVFSPANSDYDSDYLDFLAEMEAVAENPATNTSPVLLKVEATDLNFFLAPPVPALPWTDPLSLPVSSVPALSWTDPLFLPGSPVPTSRADISPDETVPPA